MCCNKLRFLYIRCKNISEFLHFWSCGSLKTFVHTDIFHSEINHLQALGPRASGRNWGEGGRRTFNQRWAIRASSVSIMKSWRKLKNRRAFATLRSVLTLSRKYFFRVSGPRRHRTGHIWIFLLSSSRPTEQFTMHSHEYLLDKGYPEASVGPLVTN